MAEKIQDNALKAGLLEVRYSTHSSFVLDYGRDIVQGRLQVVVERCPFPVQSVVDVELHYPDGSQPIPLVARISSVEERKVEGGRGELFEVGLRFSSLSATAERMLQHYLRSLRCEKGAHFVQKRSEPRFHVKLAAMVHTERGDIEGEIIDISQGGAQLITKAFFGRGQVLHCMIFLPGMNQIFVGATVQKIWKADEIHYRYAIQFTHYEANSEHDLNQYIRGLMTRQGTH